MVPETSHGSGLCDKAGDPDMSQTWAPPTRAPTWVGESNLDTARQARQYRDMKRRLTVPGEVREGFQEEGTLEFGPAE